MIAIKFPSFFFLAISLQLDCVIQVSFKCKALILFLLFNMQLLDCVIQATQEESWHALSTLSKETWMLNKMIRKILKFLQHVIIE